MTAFYPHIKTMALGLALTIIALPAIAQEGIPLPGQQQQMQQQGGNQMCMTQQQLTTAIAVSTTGTVYGVMGYCKEKNPADAAAYNTCVSTQMAPAIMGLVEHGMAPKEAIDKAVEAGIAQGRQLYQQENRGYR